MHTPTAEATSAPDLTAATKVWGLIQQQTDLYRVLRDELNYVDFSNICRLLHVERDRFYRKFRIREFLSEIIPEPDDFISLLDGERAFIRGDAVLDFLQVSSVVDERPRTISLVLDQAIISEFIGSLSSCRRIRCADSLFFDSDWKDVLMKIQDRSSGFEFDSDDDDLIVPTAGISIMTVRKAFNIVQSSLICKI